MIKTLPRFSIALTAVAILLTVVSAIIYRQSFKTAFIPLDSVISLPTGEIDGIVIFHGDESVAKFERKGNDWQFRAPDAGVLLGTAEHSAIDEMLSFAARATRVPAKISLAAAGLDDIVDLPQIVFYAGEKSQSVYLGNFSENGDDRYFLIASNIEIPLAAPAVLTRIFSRPPAQFRSRDLFAFTARPPEKIILAAGENLVEIRNTNEGWIIFRPFHWPAENQSVAALLQLCLSLRAHEFNDAALPATANTFIASISLISGNSEQTVNFYENETAGENRVLAKRTDRPEIYVVDAALMEELRNPQLAALLRQRNLDLFAGRAVNEIELQNADGATIKLSRDTNDQWQATGAERFAADNESVQNLIVLGRQLPLLDVLPENPDSQSDWHPPFVSARFFDVGGARIAEIKISMARANENSPRFLAQISGRPQLLELHPLAGLALAQPFLAYRSRTVTNFPAGEIAEIKIERTIDNHQVAVYKQIGAARYQQIEPQKRSLPEDRNWELLALLRQLAQLQCAGYIAMKTMDSSVDGLDQPLLKTTLTRRLPDGEIREITLIIGQELGRDENGAAHYAAILDGDRYIFALNEKLVERLLSNY